MSYDLQIDLSSKQIKKADAQIFLDAQKDIVLGVFQKEDHCFMNVFLEEIEVDKGQKEFVFNFHIPYSFFKHGLDEYEEVIERFTNHFNIPAIDLQTGTFLGEGANPSINPRKPSVLMFEINELEQSHGKLNLEISELIYNCPFFMYDESFSEKKLSFEDEIDINEKDYDIGFEILNKVWLQNIAKSNAPLYDSVFKLRLNENQNFYVQPIYGFLPGYNLKSAMETVIKQKYNVIRWKEFWNS